MSAHVTHHAVRGGTTGYGALTGSNAYFDLFFSLYSDGWGYREQYEWSQWSESRRRLESGDESRVGGCGQV